MVSVLEPICSEIQINDIKIVQAFYMAKMTCVEETENGNYEYTYLHLKEFYEFIGRLGWLRYKDSYEHT